MKPLLQERIWSRRSSFILAATGSAVGLGNIWKFPYITGQNGGGAFVLMYIVAILLVGIPIMIAEILIGRRARANPVQSMIKLAAETHSSKAWGLFGWFGVLTGLMILSFYSVVCGWILVYLYHAVAGDFSGLTGVTSGELFEALLARRDLMLLCHTLILLTTVIVLGLGVKKGIERSIRWLMPALFALVIFLLVYAMFKGDFVTSLRYMFSFNINDVTWDSALIAMGHSFFTLSVGMGAIMAYGSYMTKDQPIGRTVLAVACLDTLVALGVGVALFAFVFATPGISPGEGPGLMFVTLPVAFGSMSGGYIIGILFFALVVIASWTSTISLLEPGVAYLSERFGLRRIFASFGVGLIAWILGVFSALSFNDWAEVEVLWGKTFFDTMDFVASNIMLPVGGLAIALFVGWRMSRAQIADDLAINQSIFLRIWLPILRYLSPVAILSILIYGVFPVLRKVYAE